MSAESRAEARRLLRDGRLEEAQRLFSQLLDADPDDLDALNGLAMTALRRGESVRSLTLLQQALRLRPGDAMTLNNSGLAYEERGLFDAAADAYRQVLAGNPQLFIPRLRLAHALERLGRPEEALRAYFQAIRTAQGQGRWLNDASTAPVLQPLVKHALDYVAHGQRRLFSGLIAPLQARYGREAMTRVHQALDMHLGELKPDYPDPRQQPTFLYFPGLPAAPYLERELFPWMPAFEAQTTAIREELLRVLPREQGREAVFDTAKLAQENLRGAAPRWEGYYFYRHGQRREDNGRNSPRTAAAVGALPLPFVRGNAPEVMFSVLWPGTHLLPHRGVTNTRLVCHLPLIVPPDCALSVAGEQHAWREGQAVVFDDTYEHEAWNRSREIRVVLIADVWNPHLTEAERAAVAELAAGIAEFRAAEPVA